MPQITQQSIAELEADLAAVNDAIPLVKARIASAIEAAQPDLKRSAMIRKQLLDAQYRQAFGSQADVDLVVEAEHNRLPIARVIAFTEHDDKAQKRYQEAIDMESVALAPVVELKSQLSRLVFEQQQISLWIDGARHIQAGRQSRRDRIADLTNLTA